MPDTPEQTMASPGVVQATTESAGSSPPTEERWQVVRTSSVSTPDSQDAHDTPPAETEKLQPPASTSAADPQSPIPTSMPDPVAEPEANLDATPAQVPEESPKHQASATVAAAEQDQHPASVETTQSPVLSELQQQQYQLHQQHEQLRQQHQHLQQRLQTATQFHQGQSGQSQVADQTHVDRPRQANVQVTAAENQQPADTNSLTRHILDHTNQQGYITCTYDPHWQRPRQALLAVDEQRAHHRASLNLWEAASRDPHVSRGLVGELREEIQWQQRTLRPGQVFTRVVPCAIRHADISSMGTHELDRLSLFVAEAVESLAMLKTKMSTRRHQLGLIDPMPPYPMPDATFWAAHAQVHHDHQHDQHPHRNSQQLLQQGQQQQQEQEQQQQQQQAPQQEQQQWNHRHQNYQHNHRPDGYPQPSPGRMPARLRSLMQQDRRKRHQEHPQEQHKLREQDHMSSTEHRPDPDEQRPAAAAASQPKTQLQRRHEQLNKHETAKRNLEVLVNLLADNTPTEDAQTKAKEAVLAVGLSAIAAEDLEDSERTQARLRHCTQTIQKLKTDIAQLQSEAVAPASAANDWQQTGGSWSDGNWSDGNWSDADWYAGGWEEGNGDAGGWEEEDNNAGEWEEGDGANGGWEKEDGDDWQATTHSGPLASQTKKESDWGAPTADQSSINRVNRRPPLTFAEDSEHGDSERPNEVFCGKQDTAEALEDAENNSEEDNVGDDDGTSYENRHNNDDGVKENEDEDGSEGPGAEASPTSSASASSASSLSLSSVSASETEEDQQGYSPLASNVSDSENLMEREGGQQGEKDDEQNQESGQDIQEAEKAPMEEIEAADASADADGASPTL